MEESARLRLKEIKNDGSDKVSAYREAINDHASKLDVAGTFYHGKESELPSAGLIDRYFHADDSGILWRDNGTAWEPINRNYNEDTLQAGVIASTDWSFTANINSGTGALGSTGATGGGAWLPNSTISGALVRSATASATLSGIAPSKLPTSGKYISCAFELTPSTWGAAATVTAHSGTEKSTEAEAIAAPPATTAGKTQVREVIIKNTAGVYSVVAQRDRRPWARGARSLTSAGSTIVSATETKLIMPARIESSGVNLMRATAIVRLKNEAKAAIQEFNILEDGGSVGELNASVPIGAAATDYVFQRPFTSSAGSHLYNLRVGIGEATTTITSSWLLIEELPSPSANNGTS